MNYIFKVLDIRIAQTEVISTNPLESTQQLWEGSIRRIVFEELPLQSCN